MRTVEEYYHAIAPKLTNYLIGSGSSRATANDIVQETFLRLWKRRETLSEEPSQVSGLIYTIARNIRVDWARRQKRETLQEEIRDEDAGFVEDVPKGDDVAYLRQRIMAALDQLPPLIREAFVLFQVSELSIREISQITGASENLVKVRIHRAMRKLRELLAERL